MSGQRTTTRLLDAEFPRSVSSCRPSTPVAVVEVDPLVQAIKRVALVADRGVQVRLAFSGEVASVRRRGRCRAGQRDAAVEFVGAPLTIAFNPGYLLDGRRQHPLAPGRVPASPAQPRRPCCAPRPRSCRSRMPTVRSRRSIPTTPISSCPCACRADVCREPPGHAPASPETSRLPLVAAARARARTRGDHPDRPQRARQDQRARGRGGAGHPAVAPGFRGRSHDRTGARPHWSGAPAHNAGRELTVELALNSARPTARDSLLSCRRLGDILAWSSPCSSRRRTSPRPGEPAERRRLLTNSCRSAGPHSAAMSPTTVGPASNARAAKSASGGPARPAGGIGRRSDTLDVWDGRLARSGPVVSGRVALARACVPSSSTPIAPSRRSHARRPDYRFRVASPPAESGSRRPRSSSRRSSSRTRSAGVRRSSGAVPRRAARTT